MAVAPEDFVEFGAAAAPAFSRDGKTLFHLRGSGLPQVWALDLATGESRALTQHDEKVAFLRRSPTDDRLIYGIDRGGDERQQLMLIEGNAIRPLTEDPAVIHDFGAWSPDGTRIAFGANDRDEAHFDVHVLDLTSGKRERVYHGTNLVSVAAFHPDDTQLALLHERGYADMSLLLLDLPSGTVQGFAQGAPANFQSVRWTSDGRQLHALTDQGGNFMRLCRLDPSTGAMDVVYEAAGRNVEAWALSSDAATLATIENDCGYSVLRIGSPGSHRAAVADLPRGVFSDLAFSPDSSSLTFVVAAPTQPASLWVWRDASARCVWQPRMDDAPLAEFRLVDWVSFDDTTIPGFLALPAGPTPPDGHPAIVWVHGGPIGQARPNFRPDMQMLVAQGFAVLMPNVRGSSGYGRAYAESDDVDKRLDSVTDLAFAHRFLAAHPAIDAGRIGIMGQSYGGFMVLSAITEHPELWRAAVDYYGITDFVTLLATTGPWRRGHRAAEYGDPERDAALFERISPLHRAERVQVPVLIAHGTRDPRVPIGESEQFVTALQERQKPVTYLTFDYAGHGFIRPDDRRRIYRAVAEFFTAHLR